MQAEQEAVTATQVDNGSTDNCTIATRTLSQSSFDCQKLEAIPFGYIVTDVNGNVDSASAVITVQDVIKPTVVTQNCNSQPRCKRSRKRDSHAGR